MTNLLRKLKKSSKYLTLSDLILISIILILTIYLFITNLSNNSNHFVRINYQNKLVGEYPLNKDRIIKINDHIEVQIADQQVRMLKNNCPNQLCVEQGWTSSFPIICVPNQVEIIIIDKDDSKVIKHILK